MAGGSNPEMTSYVDSKILDMKDENWELMEKLISVLQPFQVAIAILSSETSPLASACLPMIRGLITNHLKVKDDDNAAVYDFKADARSEVIRSFPIDDATHPFMTASVLDPAHKHLRTFLADVREAAYKHVCDLLAKVTVPKTPGSADNPNK